VAYEHIPALCSRQDRIPSLIYISASHNVCRSVDTNIKAVYKCLDSSRMQSRRNCGARSTFWRAILFGGGARNRDHNAPLQREDVSAYGCWREARGYDQSRCPGYMGAEANHTSEKSLICYLLHVGLFRQAPTRVLAAGGANV
jgi:hypothetical protein